MREMIHAFLWKANENDEMAEREKIERGTIYFLQEILEKNTGALWAIKRGDEWFGYIFCEMGTSKYLEPCCFINHVYVDKSLWREKILYRVERVAVKWAKEQKAKHVVWWTERNSAAFQKRVSTNWKYYATVFSQKT